MKPINQFISENCRMYIDEGGRTETLLDWRKQSRENGYFEVCRSKQPPPAQYIIGQWCVDKFGSEHYSWDGTSWWFDSEENAVLFALRWA